MANKKKTRMYEPWGYQDENNYKSTEILVENDFDAFLVDTSYNKDDNKIYFTNKDGEVKASLDVNEFVKSDSIIEKTEYKDGILKIYFTNGDVVTIDLTELLDENEFKDGLMVDNHVVKVLINSADSDDYISVDINGIKLTGVKADIEAEEARAISAETALDEKIDAEIARATAEEQRIDAKLDQEISDRIADVDEEETRASSEEQRIETKLDEEITRAKRIEQALNSELDSEEVAREAGDAALGVRIDNEINDRKADVNEEEARAKAAEEALQGAIDDEAARATSAETDLQAAIEAEGQRAQDAEAALDEKIDAEEARAYSAESELAEGIEILGSVKFDEVLYDSSAKTITFYAEGNRKGEIDTTDFVKDGMISDVKIEDGKLKIIFNTDSGKEEIDIPLTDIFNPDNYYDKTAVDGFISDLEAADGVISGAVDNVSADLATEVQRALSAETDLQDAINLKANSADVDAALALKADKSEIPTDFYTKGEIDGKETALQTSIEANTAAISAEEARALSAETDLQAAIDLKADKETTYTQEEVDALLLAKENEIYNLTKIVGDMGGAVTYEYPNEAGKSLTTLLGNNGTVKLGEDATISRFGPGVMASNKVKLNLNNHNLTATSAGDKGAIMARGTQEITIGGKGTVEAGDGVCIEANGASSVINLTGSTTIYHNNRSGAELIYCYDGTINITNGTFRNDGEDKKYLLNCYDANYRAGTAKIIVTGGKFYDFNPADNSAEGEHTSFVPVGYHVEESQDGDSTVYTVKKDA